MHIPESGHARIDVDGRALRVEYAWVGPAAAPAGPSAGEAGPVARATAQAPLVFLHEGLGSIGQWKDFPTRLCQALDRPGLVYARPGYGRSTPRPADERWQPDYLHRQALDVLPALLAALHVEVPPWLFGHSDGGSIALLHAAHRPTAGIVVLAPHVFVEPVAREGIGRAARAYRDGALRERLARYHDDPDSAFYGWHDAWTDPAFTDWDIRAEIAAITCPVLAIQGLDDEYGTLRQVHDIAARVPQAEVLELPHCGHIPHQDQAQAVIAATCDLIPSRARLP